MPKRIVFDIDDETVKESIPFVIDEKMIAHYAKKAYLEWLKRMKARNDRAKKR